VFGAGEVERPGGEEGGGEDVLRGFRGPMVEGIVRAERRAEGGSGWKNDVFDPQK